MAQLLHLQSTLLLSSRLEKCSKNQFKVVTCKSLHLGSLKCRHEICLNAVKDRQTGMFQCNYHRHRRLREWRRTGECWLALHVQTWQSGWAGIYQGTGGQGLGFFGIWTLAWQSFPIGTSQSPENLLICVRFSTHKNFEKLHFRRVEGVGLLEGSL